MLPNYIEKSIEMSKKNIFKTVLEEKLREKGNENVPLTELEIDFSRKCARFGQNGTGRGAGLRV